MADATFGEPITRRAAGADQGCLVEQILPDARHSLEDGRVTLVRLRRIEAAKSLFVVDRFEPRSFALDECQRLPNRMRNDEFSRLCRRRGPGALMGLSSLASWRS